MKRILSLAAVSLLMAGCHNNPPASSSTASGVTQLSAPPPAPAQPQPMTYDQATTASQTTAIDTSTPTVAGDASVGTPAVSGGGKYVVKAHDTLYHIAVSHYGDGKQWKKIAAANPGLTPATLKAGQTIILP